MTTSVWKASFSINVDEYTVSSKYKKHIASRKP